MTGTLTGGEQRPWGRTSVSDFQVALAERFHCILCVPIPSFPFSQDYLTVWKRTSFFVRDDDHDDGDHADDEEGNG